MRIEIIIIAIVIAGLMSLLIGLIFYLSDSYKWITTIRTGADEYNKGELTKRLQQSSWSEKMTPIKFRTYQCFTAILGFALLLKYNAPIPVCIGIGISSFFLPDLLLKQKIKKENLMMLEDMEHLYHLLYLLTASGSFFLDSLIDAYKMVKCWRLKKALIDLTGAISAKKDISQAATVFSDKFNNQYISTMADIICYCATMGDVSSMLESVSEQIAGIQNARYIQEKGNQEFKEVLISALLFIGGVAAVIFLHYTVVLNESSLLLLS